MRFVLSSTLAAAMMAAPLMLVTMIGQASTGATSLPALFKQLDANGDGLLSRQEAAAVPSIANAYDSFDTQSTIQQPDDNAHPAGITLQQFQAGMQAANRSGAFGPAVSGGQTYLQYPDGSRVPLSMPEDNGGS